MELELYKLEALEIMDKAVENYKIQLSRISTGRANPQVLNSVNVIYYDSPTPINQLSAISVPEPRQLLIRPFDASINKDIVAAINAASLGLNAVDEGDKTRISIPDLTRERRLMLVKQVKESTENAKIGIRHGRQLANKMIKGDDELNEDDEKYYLEEIQKLTDKKIKIIDELTSEKEIELTTI